MSDGDNSLMNTVTGFGRKAMSELGETVRFFAGVAAVWFVLVTFGFAAFHIPSESMQPALQVGDRVLVSKWAYGYSRHSLPLGMGYLLPESWSGRILGSVPERGDVVVIRDPGQGINLIKRVVGLPGDTIEVRAGRLYINGALIGRERLVREGYDPLRYRDHDGNVVNVSEYIETLPNDRTHIIFERGDDQRYDNMGPFRVPADHVFLMGDNRDRSEDSRAPYGVGYVHTDQLVGRAETVLFTFARCRNEDGLFCPPWRVWRGL